MKSGHWGWKTAAVLLCIVAAGDLAAKARTASPIGEWAESLGLAFAAIGLVQYGFGWPNIGRTVWRVFGPPFSVLMAWSIARDFGWLGTRLAVRRLTTAEQAATASLLVLLAVYALIVLVPLYRLAEWRLGNQTQADDDLAELSDTFA